MTVTDSTTNEATAAVAGLAAYFISLYRHGRIETDALLQIGLKDWSVKDEIIKRAWARGKDKKIRSIYNGDVQVEVNVEVSQHLLELLRSVLIGWS